MAKLNVESVRVDDGKVNAEITVERQKLRDDYWDVIYKFEDVPIEDFAAEVPRNGSMVSAARRYADDNLEGDREYFDEIKYIKDDPTKPYYGVMTLSWEDVHGKLSGGSKKSDKETAREYAQRRKAEGATNEEIIAELTGEDE